MGPRIGLPTVEKPAMFWLSIALFLGTAQGSDAPKRVPVQIKSGKQTFAAVQVSPPGKGPFPAVVMLHGDFGLTEWTRKQADRLAGKSYLVLAVDLYDGELPKTIEDAHILERGLDERRVVAQIKSAVDYLQQLPLVRKDAIGVIGWDCGGGYALDAAIADKRLRAAVMCYGRVTTDAKLLARLEAPVLAIFAGKDEGIPPATIDRFKQAMHKAGKALSAQVYPSCGNGFMDPTSPYLEGPPDQTAIADAWTRIEGHLAKSLK
jgi:carboxymethylenebutenolidase